MNMYQQTITFESKIGPIKVCLAYPAPSLDVQLLLESNAKLKSALEACSDLKNSGPTIRKIASLALQEYEKEMG